MLLWICEYTYRQCLTLYSHYMWLSVLRVWVVLFARLKHATLCVHEEDQNLMLRCKKLGSHFEHPQCKEHAADVGNAFTCEHTGEHICVTMATNCCVEDVWCLEVTIPYWLTRYHGDIHIYVGQCGLNWVGNQLLLLKFEHEWAIYGWWGTVNIIYIGTSHNNNTNSFSHPLLNSGLAAMKETLWFMIVAESFSHSWPFRKGQCMCARMCCVSFPCSTWLWGRHHGRGLSFPWQPCKGVVKLTKV